MKRIYLFLAAIILTINISLAQTGWVDYKIDNRVSAKLPTAPQTLVEGSVMSLTPDSTVCIVTKVDFKASANLDSATLAPLLGTEEFAAGLRTGMLQQMNGFTLSEAKTGKLHGQYTYSLDGVSESQKLKSYTLMVVMGQYLYSFTALVKDGRDTTHRDEFFSSIQIK
jgi:hypothetical protein